jgi:steroid delta-isomerase
MTDSSNTAKNVATYIDALETLSVQSMDDFLALCAPVIEFRDPFNHTFNRDDFRRVLIHMLKQVDGLQFNVSQHWHNGPAFVIQWRFSGKSRFIGALDIPGLSEVEFDDDGMVRRHIDYWDANEHITCKLPVIGPLVRLAMRPMSI